MTDEVTKPVDWVKQVQDTALELAKKTKEGLMTFDDAVKQIENIDLSDLKLEGDTFQLRISMIFYAGGEDTKLQLANFFGEDCLIGKNKLDQYTKSKALWELWLAQKEIEHLKEVVDRQNEIIESTGYFDPEEERNDD